MKIFVYGTLKRTQAAGELLSGQQFLRNVLTAPHYRLVDCGGYPGLIESAEGVAVEGELWEIDADCRALLDDYEGVHEGLYRVCPVLLDMPDEEAQAYFFLGDTLGLADCGPRWPPLVP